MLVIALTQGTTSILYQYGSLFLDSFHFSTTDITTIFFVIALLGAGLSVYVDKLIRVIGAHRLVLRVFVTSLIAALLLLLHQLIAALAFFVILNVLFELWDTTLNVLLHDLVSDQHRTTMVSLVNQLTAFLMGVESIMIGWLTKSLDISLIFIILATGMFLISIPLFISARKQLQ